MKIRTWLACVVMVGGFGAYEMRGCLSKAPPDEKLAGRFEAMCKIAKDNIETPEKGVRKLGGYLLDHTDDILGELGGTITTIERIKNDDKHDQRARVARDRIRKPLSECEE